VATINHALVTDLLVDGGAVSGVAYLDRNGRRRTARARATLLATGGGGQLCAETTNPAIATGDGVALAYHAGARVADLEFVQFHPTALSVSGAPRFLISEAIRGEGARLVNAKGEALMARYHPDGDLAPRDVVARSIVREAQRTGAPVYLSVAHLDRAAIVQRFPTIARVCRQAGLDLASDPIPVGPAAHYLMGGIDTDEWGRTSLPGLFAAGETACTGVHGANRLASNSLLEGLAFGARAALAMQEPPRAAPLRADRRIAGADASPGGVPRGDRPPWTRAPGSAPLDVAGVRELMWRSVGLFRKREGLLAAVAALDDACEHAGRQALAAAAPDPDCRRFYNLVTVARLVARAALRREESRGAHFRLDFPDRSDERWKFHAVEVRQAVDVR
jgi:L-aspartate oxidase